MTIHSKKSHADLAREHMFAGRISKDELVQCLRLDCIVTKTTISSAYGEEKLYPNRALMKRVDRMLGKPCPLEPGRKTNA